MRDEKRRRLEAKGWKVWKAKGFLKLSEEAAAYVELKLRLAHSLKERRRRRRLTQVAFAKEFRSNQSLGPCPFSDWRASESPSRGAGVRRQ
jgi:hypothetical protein